MRVVVLSDIHGNIVALEAVLAEIATLAPDRVVCLGDVAAAGPRPVEVIDRLRQTGWDFVEGNTDAWLLDPQPTRPEDPEARRYEEMETWGASQLDGPSRAFLGTFQSRVEVDLGGPTLLAYHGGPESFWTEIHPTTGEDELDRIFASTDAAVYAGGHTHIAMVRRHREAFVVNPGSVGLPFSRTADDRMVNPVWAEYAVITAEAGRLAVELRRTPVDWERVVASTHGSELPHLAWWLEQWAP